MNLLGRSTAGILLLSAVVLPLQPVDAGELVPLRQVGAIALPDARGRIDHLEWDEATGRLFVAALASNTVDIVDTARGASVGAVRGLREPQGVLSVAARRLLAVANGGDGTLRFFDERTLAPVTSLQFPGDADNLRYDDARDRVYVGYGGGGIGIVDASSLHRIADVPLAGHPESFQLEKRGRRMFVNVPAGNRVVVIDREQGRAIAEWRLPGPCENFPMDLDEDGGRLFIGCRAPAGIMVLDAANGALLHTFPIAADVDDVFFDRARRRVYASCGAGVLQAFEETAERGFAPAGSIATRPGARTSLFVPARSRIYVALPRADGNAAEIRVYEVQR
ncbi:MAG TPA: hypothetical protein VI078_10900 [bacterium]